MPGPLLSADDLAYLSMGRTLAGEGGVPLAAQRGPSLLAPGPEGSWPLRFDRLVQPVLDRGCLPCHQPGAEGKEFLLTADRSWKNLLEYGDRDLHKLVFERDASQPGESPSKNSRLIAYLESDPVHRDLVLSKDDWRRLQTWMDTYGHIRGSFTDQQDRELETLRERGGVKVYGCSTSVKVLQLTPKQLGRVDAVMGHASFMSIAEGGQLVVI